ncbi:MAG: RagB/SusD family nutrient uptake outer membrane protein [Dysgonamonadaceae bacterium]|jgi:hypothetical protein|nr:RagB/SusD family nutrient uptake outer membrane protein [Dysgonamonadaceae bacterium]
MKKLFVSSSLLFLAFSCQDLDLSPEGSVFAEYKTEVDAVAAISGVYSALTYEAGDIPLYGDALLYISDLSSDYMTIGAHSNSAETRNLSSAAYGADNQRIDLIWKQLYRGINRANIAIDNIPAVNAPENVKSRLINEAKFLRALYYFNAVQLFGEVPLVLHEVSHNAGLYREEVDKVYEQIIRDLTDAEELPTPNVDPGRATGGAAAALLSRVYLVWASLKNPSENYGKAIEYAEKVIVSQKYELFENFFNIFDIATKNGKEHIFSAQYIVGQASATSSGNSITHCVWSSGFSNSLEPVILISDTALFYDIYSDSDQRKSGSYAKHLYNPATNSIFTFEKPRFRKYIDTTAVLNTSGGRPVNTPIIRYADVLFTLAEATNELYGPTDRAYWAINQIRRRAFRQDLDTPSGFDFKDLTKEQFRDSLREERYKEFVTESVRWFDLVRWKIYVKSVRKTKPAASFRNYRFPIPQKQRDVNPDGLWQNWGYSGEDSGANPYLANGYE